MKRQKTTNKGQKQEKRDEGSYASLSLEMKYIYDLDICLERVFFSNKLLIKK